MTSDYSNKIRHEEPSYRYAESDLALVRTILFLVVILFCWMLASTFAKAAELPALRAELREDLRNAGYHDVGTLRPAAGLWSGEAVRNGAWVRFEVDPGTGRVVSESLLD